MLSYRRCLKEEYVFEKKIEEIHLCVKNLINIFTEDIVSRNDLINDLDNYANKSSITFKNATLQRNQNYLLNNKILENLYNLFKIMVQFCYFSLVNFKSQGQEGNSLNRLYFILNKEEDFFQLKLPQNFFRDYLERIIESIIKIFYLVSYNNSKTSAFFLKRFDVFYHLTYFYRKNIIRFLNEITSNSDKMEGDHNLVLQTLFDDLELPSFKRDFIQRHSNKLKLIKNIVKNLSKQSTIDNINGIGQMVQNFSVAFDRNFYIQFDRNLEGEIVCKFYFVKLSNLQKTFMKNKIKKIKKNICKIFQNYFEEIELADDNFDIIQISLEGLKTAEELHGFLKYYMKLKTRFFYANMNMGIMLMGLKNLEEDPSKGVLFSMSLDSQINNSVKAGVVSFISKVYLFFKKYNYFTDDYDFTYFCQKL